MKVRRFVLLIALGVLALSACTPETIVETVVVSEVETIIVTEEPEVPFLGTLTVGIPVVVVTLDPVAAVAVMIQNVALTPYESLTFLNAETGEVEPLLAESWDVVDSTTYEFHLREGVQFHNGEPFNADAVVFSYELQTADDPLANGFAWQTTVSVEKIDEYTVQITTSAPDPVFLKRMGTPHATIYPPVHAAEVGYDGLNSEPIGTGPFIFEEWVRGDKVVYVANPDYWGGAGVAGVETIVFKSIPEADARIAALEVGEIDIALDLPPSQIGVIMDAPDLKVSRALGTRIFYVMYDNISSGIGTPLEDVRVRQALIYAVDRQAIVDTVFGGNAKVLNTFIGPTQFGHNPDLPPFPYDPEKAQELLTEAGYPDGFSISMACPADYYAKGVEACQAIIGYLDEFLDIELVVREANLHWDLECKHEFEPMFFDGAGDRFLDPSYPVNVIMLPEVFCWAPWDNPGIKALLIEASEIVDQDKRKEIYFEVADLLQSDPAGIPLWQVYNFTALNTRVSGFVPWSTELLNLRGVQVTK